MGNTCKRREGLRSEGGGGALGWERGGKTRLGGRRRGSRMGERRRDSVGREEEGLGWEGGRGALKWEVGGRALESVELRF